MSWAYRHVSTSCWLNPMGDRASLHLPTCFPNDQLQSSQFLGYHVPFVGFQNHPLSQVLHRLIQCVTILEMIHVDTVNQSGDQR